MFIMINDWFHCNSEFCVINSVAFWAHLVITHDTLWHCLVVVDVPTKLHHYLSRQRKWDKSLAYVHDHNPTVIWWLLPEEHPQIFTQTFYFYELESSAYCLSQVIWVYTDYTSFKFFGGHHIFYLNQSDVSADQGYPRPFILGMNWKRVWDILVVVMVILHWFGDIAFLLCSWPHHYSSLILGMFLLHQIVRVRVSPSINLMLFGHENIFEVFRPMWLCYVNVLGGQMDGQKI